MTAAPRPEADDAVSARLAAWLAHASLSALPAAVRDQTKIALIDTVGAAIVGANRGDGHQAAVAAMKAASGNPEATIWATGERIEARRAAFCNAIHARAHDYDDIMVFPQVHVSVCTVPAAVAAAELAAQREGPISGRRLIEAIAAGAEMQTRLTLAYAPYHDASRFPVMLPTQVFGYFGAAAAAGRALALSTEAMESAIGLAQMQAGGTEEMVVHATESVGKCIYAGFSVDGGLQAALFAEAGVVARGRPLEGEAGLFAAFFGGRFDAERLTGGLGEEFLSLQRCIKAMPGTLVAHAFVEAGLALCAEHGLTGDDIVGAQIVVGPWGKAMCEPAASRRAPETASTAMNSIPFLLANALVKGRVALSDMTPEGRTHPATLAMARRITHRLDPAMAAPRGLEAARLVLTLADGRTLEGGRAVPQGHPDRPLSFDDIARKFRSNLAPDGDPASLARADRILLMVERLEEMPDIAPLIAFLSPDDRGRHGD
ncbi:MmgE/PrpD family protein [Acuticoccus mangrovi]|uniref:MmgE/PrpD family protein n=1 Tax=Acuticoccus mangrovi TaxID=2796142 RepID=A0A934ISX0_9HYPH|nr:MmgE/PrpD family protein [Acuticoccus mangrovi]